MPGLQRAHGGQRPGQPAHHGDLRRRDRRVRRSTARRSGSPPPTWPPGACSSCAPTRPPSSGARSTRGSPPSSSTSRRRASTCGRSATWPARSCSTRSSSPTCASRPRGASATRAPAGWWPWAPSASSASASPSQIAILAADLRAMVEAARSVNPGALEDPSLRDRIAKMWTEIELARLLSLRALSQDHEGREELARGALRQAVVVVDGPDAGRAGRRPAGSGRRCWPGAAPTRSTGASGPASTPSSATRPSAAARPRSRRTSSPTGPSPCPASRAPEPTRSARLTPPTPAPPASSASPATPGTPPTSARAARPSRSTCGSRWPVTPRPTPAPPTRPPSSRALESIDVVYSQSWQYDDAVARLAERLGASPARRRYSGIGGSVPQRAGRRGGRVRSGRATSTWR